MLGDKMSGGCIYNIDLKTNNNDIIRISSDYFNNFYIANIDDCGDEIGYEPNDDNSLSANFFMLKVLNDKSNESIEVINRLSEKKDIIGVDLCFTNGSKQNFKIAKKRVVNNGTTENIYQDTFFDEENLCIMITDKKIKYKKELFV